MENIARDEFGICSTSKSYDVLDGCILRYYENFLSKELTDFYYETFELLPFTQGRVRSGLENRQSCFCSTLVDDTGNLKKYSYSGKINTPIRFSDEMKTLADTITQTLLLDGEHAVFNSCLANLYVNGSSNIGYHSDSERDLAPGSIIASISLGAERYFDVAATDDVPYRIDDREIQRKISIRVKHGSMVIMGGKLQNYYKHQLRREAACRAPRINLTFRHAI